MPPLELCDIAESNSLQLQAARLLHRAFIDTGDSAWPDMRSAMQEVEECIEGPSLCIGACVEDSLLGWVGLRPMYEKTWELHPLVVKAEYRRQGIGRLLLRELESRARDTGIIGIVLGTDDEHEKTSLSLVDIDGENIFREIGRIRNLRDHPFGFYEKCGYAIIGLVPNANGIRKPDIWMWKAL